MKFERVPGVKEGDAATIKVSPTLKLFSFELTIAYKNMNWYDKITTREQFFHENWTDANRRGLKDGRCVYLAGAEHRRDGFYFTWDVDAYDSK